jgi:hypothetical protein
MAKPANHTAKLALRDFLARRYQDDIAKLNEAWGAGIQSFDDILRHVELSGSNRETVISDKAAFLALIAERYFSCTTKAIRAIDPDHLILGCRFAGGHATADVWAAAAEYCDVLTLNYYGNVDLDREIALDDEHSCRGDPLGVPFAGFAKLACGKPLMVTEWSFIALDSGLPCTNGAGQRFRTQAQRAKAAGIFAETLLRIPEVIGFDYFMWADEPALGISSSFPENSNYGLVNGDNEVYQDLVNSLSGVLKQAGRLHRDGPTELAPTQPPAPPTTAQLLERLSKQADADAPPLNFQREGESFTISNGKLTLKGAIEPGPALQSMRLDDVELGRFVNTAHQLLGHPEWPRANFVNDARKIPAPDRLEIQLTCSFHPVDPGDQRPTFELVQRLHMLPNTDWFLVELISYRNTSSQPVELGGVYFQIFSALGGDAAHDQPASGDQVPRLWGRRSGDAWIDETNNAFIGMVAPRYAPLKARFWLNDHGGQHPDAHWPVGRILAPGETLTPDQPVCWIVTAGRGGHDEWLTRLQTPALR